MRHALRYWGRHRGHAMWLVLSLGGALGLAAAVVAVANAVWWRPLPVRAPEQLVRVYVESGRGDGRLAPNEYPVWKARQDALQAIASYQFDIPVFLDTGARTVRLEALHVTTNLFGVLGVTPVAGRLFGKADAPAGAPDVAIISERLWRRDFGADPTVIGRHVRFVVGSQSQPATIIGVVPAGLDVQTHFTGGVDLYRPITDGVAGESFGTYWAVDRHVIGRLRPDVTRAVAEGRLLALARDVATELNLRSRPTALRLIPLHDELYGANRPFVMLLLLAGAFALLVAIANAAGIVMALASRRSGERAIRLALGASTRQLAGQVLAESAVVGAATAVVAVVVAHGTVALLVGLAPAEIRRMNTTAMGWTETLLAAGLALAAGVLVTTAPLVRRRVRTMSTTLTSAAVGTMTPATLRMRRALIAAQAAVVLALVACAALVLASFWRLASQPLGFSDRGVLVARFQVPETYSRDVARVRALVDDLRRAALAAPGSRQVAVAFFVPLDQRYGWIRVRLPDGRNLEPVYNNVTEGFFEVLGIPVVAGRVFRRTDMGAGDYVVVNQAFADRYLGGAQRAIGQRLQARSSRPDEVIGVVGNVREQRLTMALDPVVYYPVWDMTPSRLHLLSHERGAEGAAIASLLSAFRRVDPGLFVDITPLASRRRAEMAGATLQATLIGGLAAFTFVLAAMGIYGMVAQLSADRARELGIRAALGATPTTLVRLLVRSTMASMLAGIAGGLALTTFAVRVLRAFLFETDAFDARLWVLAVCVIASSASLAAWLPARRAAKVDPVSVLRDT